MRLPLRASRILIGLLALSSPASATVVASQSFEAPVLNSPGIQYGPDEFSTNTNEVGPVVIANFTFVGFSGIIKNGSLGVFPDTTSGTQAAFVQSYLGTGSEIEWQITGLTPGEKYLLSFQDAGSFVVPAEPFSVTAFGGSPVSYTPGSSYTTQTLTFTALTSSGFIDFVGPVTPSVGNQASAIDHLSVSTVPEPLTLSLFGAGLAAAAAMRRRGSRNRSRPHE